MAAGLDSYRLSVAAVGYSQAPPSPLSGFAPVLGVYGTTLMTALLAALISEALRRWVPVEPSADSRNTWTKPARWRAVLPTLILSLIHI